MVILIPATGERLTVRLVEEPFGPLCLKVGRPERIAYVLKPVLDIGWQIVESTPDEQALLETHSIRPAPRPGMCCRTRSRQPRDATEPVLASARSIGRHTPYR
jgi:hypothetical protein